MASDKELELTGVDALEEVLGLVFRFEYNIDRWALLVGIFGDRHPTDPYIKEKASMLDRRGLSRLYCDLDMANQRKVAEMMVHRYKGLENLKWRQE